jgi:DNA mismatch endonuclease, patch repair protein
MSDIVSPDTRRRIMQSIRGKNTKPEICLRKGLHGLGFRFRLHDRRLPGKPDLVFPKYRAVIFVHGCFWHGHECHMFKWPKTRKNFWFEKITRNRRVDATNIEQLVNSGWRICVVWECSMRGKYRLRTEEVVQMCANWLQSESTFIEIAGVPLSTETEEASAP